MPKPLLWEMITSQALKIPVALLFFSCTYLPTTNAQLCQGSLGDPVVDITFGSGPNPGSPLGGATNYQYVPNDCPNDGYYTVANATSKPRPCPLLAMSLSGGFRHSLVNVRLPLTP